MFNLFKKTQNASNPDSSISAGLQSTRKSLIEGLVKIFTGKKAIDANLLAEIETKLLISDLGIQVTAELIQQLKSVKNLTPESALTIIKNQLLNILQPCEKQLALPQNIKPFVILVVGVNGSGKTTTIGKLAKKLQNDNRKVMLAAGDTFRAAAIEQLKIWGERNRINVIAQKPGSDSAAVIYDALQAAKARDIDILIADTAGRLHTQHNFMEELKKIKKIIQKLDPTAPHEILLILDATIGQNAMNQVKQFNEIIGVTGICITKLDGTAKGGAIFAIAKETKIPIRFIGLGENIDDLKPFDAQNFINALFGE